MSVPAQPVVASAAGDTTSVTWSFLQYLDGSWVDIGSMLLAVAIVCVQRHRTPKCSRCAFFTRSTARELASALTVFPLFLLTISSVFTKITPHLLNGSRITLTVAGGYALFSMLEDLQQTPSTPLTTVPPAPEHTQVVPPSAVEAANDSRGGGSAAMHAPPGLAPARTPSATDAAKASKASSNSVKKNTRKRNRGSRQS